MGFLDWLHGTNMRQADDHALTSGGYSFFLGATSSGRPVTGRSAMQMRRLLLCADPGRGSRRATAACV